MLTQQARKQQDRSKPSLSQVRLEMFKGSRTHYKEWKRTIEAQRALYRLDDAELAMLIYLSCQGEPRQILNQLQIEEMREPGGLNRVLRLLEESYGARADDRFEEKQEAYLTYRRTPGQAIASYISTLKRLRAEYLAEDTGTTLSDKSFAQRMLSRASLTKKERMDIFYSAGGKYVSTAIEKVLRFRCANIHAEEGKYKAHDRQPRKWKHSSTSRSARYHQHRSSRAHLAEVKEEPDWDDDEEGIPEEDEGEEALYEEDDWDEADEEDLEQEAWNQGYYSHWEWDEEEGWEDDGMDLREAYAAGWRAKQKSAEARKARGYSDGKSKGKGKKGGRFVEYRSKDQRKAKSKRASCKQTGHWHGDPECPNVKNGTDPPREDTPKSSTQVHFATDSSPQARGSNQVKEEPGSQNKSTKGLQVHKVNWTFMEGWQRIKAYSSDSSSVISSSSSSSEEEPLAFTAGKSPEQAKEKASKYKAALRTVLAALEEEADEDDHKLKRRLEKKKEKVKEKEKELRAVAAKSKARPMETDLPAAEMLEILPYMSKEEKKQLYKKLKEERDMEASKQLFKKGAPEKVTRPDKKKEGYTAASSSTTPAPEPASVSTLPEPVRKKRLKEFRRALYEGALDRKGRVKPSEASELPTPEQDRCRHPYERLRWGANGAAHWASCRDCHLKKVLYYSMDHGALTANNELEDPMETWMLEHAAHKVILDSGCRTAVAGARWHKKMQQSLDEMQLPYEVLEHEETFRFGAGAPVLSTSAGLYPVVLGKSGIRTWLRVAVVEDTKDDPRISTAQLWLDRLS